MKSYLFYSFLILAFLLASSLISASQRVIIKNVNLIDAASPFRENMTVVLQGGVIRLIEKSSSKIINIKKTDNIIEAEGKFLIVAYSNLNITRIIW